MRVLLDTNIIIHREASRLINRDIGTLFNWLDRLHYSKCVHPLTELELKRHVDAQTVATMGIKLSNYQILKTEAPLNDEVKRVAAKIDTTPNDNDDTRLLNELYCDRVDLLISEDKKIHTKASLLGLSDKVFRIESFLEKVLSENPDLVDYKVLSVKKEYFGKIDLSDHFFDSFREDYVGFDKWFNKKADNEAYICYDNTILAAFLFLKIEDEKENYSDITPPFPLKKRLKIGTFKVTSNGIKLGERFLKIIFDNARQYKVEEIYVTIFDKRPEQSRLISLLEQWGFKYHGFKKSPSGDEKVYVRNFLKQSNRDNPKLTYPYLSKESDVYIVPIYPEYHTELFPDSILRTEEKEDFLDNEPHRNAISKSYISHSRERNLKRGDIIVFYRTGGFYQGVATTIGIVEDIFTEIKDENELVKICRKRTILKEEELKKWWNRYRNNKPFVVNFLYAYSFKRRPNLKQLIQMEVIPSIFDMPRGFRKINWEVFTKLVRFSGL